MSGEREQILQQLRAGLRAQGETLRAMAAQTPCPNPAGPFLPPQPDLVAQFCAVLTQLKCYPHVCADATAALAVIRKILTDHQATEVLSWSLTAVPLSGLDELLRTWHIALAPDLVRGVGARDTVYARLDPVPVGISGVDAAVAESGTMIVVSGVGQGRLASLLPPTHIAVLPRDRIVRALPDALALLRQRYGDALFRDRSNVTLISGPSSTGDVGGELVLGVHGPAEVHAVII